VHPDFTALTDADLARESAAGSMSSFEELVRRHETNVYRFLWSCLRNDADAEELTQAVFVTAYGALKSYRPTHPFVAWLLTIARHRVIDHCRSAARRESTADAPSRLVDERDPASILAEREDQEETWASARRLLPPDQFQAVYLKYGEDLSVREIARVLGRTSTSVKVLLFRARRTLVAAWNRQAVRPPLGNSNSRLRPSRPVPAPQPQLPLRAR